ncbi:MAG: hypothetical protein K2O00_01490 [Muribaculaceae bacterium]|nr:hypothetical protein [Muribaculaceae bacterium]
MRLLPVIIALVLLSLVGCRHSASDSVLIRAEQLVDSVPQQTLAILDTISQQSLSDHDLYLYHFLTIKANDKLFIDHTSDSLLLLALHYGNKYPRSVNLPELHYYAGRVYTDIGDYPTALEFYHEALDEVPDDKDLILRAKVLANMGFIFDNAHMYEHAVNAHIEAIKIDSILGDTLNMLYDLVDLGNSYYIMNDYAKS